MIERFANILFFLAIFFLPWQTAIILGGVEIGGQLSQYGKFAVYLTEVLIACAFILKRPSFVHLHQKRIHQAAYWFFAVCFFSLTFSSVGLVGWYQMIHVVSAVLFYLLLIDEQTNLNKVLVVFLAGLVIPIGLGWAQLDSGMSPESSLLGISFKDAQTAGVAVIETTEGRMMRAYGTFPHPNMFGGYCVLGIFALAWLARSIKNKKQLYLLLCAAAILGSALIVTFSRSAWLGLFLGFSVLIGLMVKYKRMPPRSAMPVMTLGFISVLFTLSVFYPQVISRFNPSLRLETISIEERTNQYTEFDEVFFSAPLLGVGPGAYTFTLVQQNPGQPVWVYQPIHNVFLLLLSELGVIGVMVGGYIIYTFFFAIKKYRSQPEGMFAAALAGTFLLIGMFDHYLWSLWPGLALTSFAFALLTVWLKPQKVVNS